MKALVTGASSGIGRDIARELSKKGYDLVIVARDEKNLNDLKEEIESNTSSKVKVECMDLGVVENCKNLYENNKDIDLLINNAGFGTFGLFEKIDLDKELSMIDINIKAVHILTKLYLRDMKVKNCGQILNVASIGGVMPGPLMSAYYASKSYVVRLSEGIREELRREKSNVKISVLCPGPVRTNFNNVAGVNFMVSSLSSEYVARYAVKKLQKTKFWIVPGFTIQLARVGSKIAPDLFVAKITYKAQKSKEKK